MVGGDTVTLPRGQAGLSSLGGTGALGHAVEADGLHLPCSAKVELEGFGNLEDDSPFRSVVIHSGDQRANRSSMLICGV